MTNEEKEIVFHELCTRAPYGVKFRCGKNNSEIHTAYEINLTNGSVKTRTVNSISADIYMYLRPMTDKEKEEYFNICDEDIKILSDAISAPDIIISDKGRMHGYVVCKELEWLYEHHFDFIRKIGDKYTTLTDLGLALKAPKGMYS